MTANFRQKYTDFCLFTYKWTHIIIKELHPHGYNCSHCNVYNMYFIHIINNAWFSWFSSWRSVKGYFCQKGGISLATCIYQKFETNSLLARFQYHVLYQATGKQDLILSDYSIRNNLDTDTVDCFSIKTPPDVRMCVPSTAPTTLGKL